MSDDLFNVPQPRARTSDPSTSHDAARSMRTAADTIRADVERWALGRGPEGFIDEELSAAFDAADSSSYRTRRGELTVAGVIVSTGRERTNGNGRKCIVWMHRSHKGQYAAPDRPLTLAERLVQHANRLDDSSKWFRGQGFVGHATELAETAALIREALEAGKARKNTPS